MPLLNDTWNRLKNDLFPISSYSDSGLFSLYNSVDPGLDRRNDVGIRREHLRQDVDCVVHSALFLLVGEAEFREGEAALRKARIE